MRKAIWRSIFWMALLVMALPTRAQNGTQHGILVSWTASTSTNVAGYNVYQAIYSAGVWAKVNTSLVTGTSYLEPSASLTTGTEYEYAATAVDSTGNESSYSNIVTVTAPTAWPVNPAPPSGCNAKVQ